MLGHGRGELGSYVIRWLRFIGYMCIMLKVYTHTCYSENLNLSKCINVITCFVKEFIMLLNLKKYCNALNSMIWTGLQ